MTSFDEIQIPTRDLPIWMRKALQPNDYGALLVVALCLLMSLPLMINRTVAPTTATENHIYQTAVYSESLREGRLYPRWNAHALTGYGAPIPHYTPPGTPYFTALIDIFITGNPTAAVRYTYVLALILAGFGTYTFVLRHMGAVAALMVAVFYVGSPYTGNAIYILGNLPGMLAFGLMPVLLWSVDRLYTTKYPIDFALVSFTTAALILIAPLHGMVALVMASLLLLWHIRSTRRARYYMVISVTALLTGVLLASFYWFPLIAERHLVRWEAIQAVRRPYLLTWQAIIKPAAHLDPAAAIAYPVLTLGWLQIGLALASAVMIWRRFTLEILYLVFGLLILVVGITVFPRQIWLLGPATLCFALGSMRVFSHFNRFNGWKRLLLLAAGLLAIYGLSSPTWLVTSAQHHNIDTSPLAQLQYELDEYGIAALPPNHLYPTTLAIEIQPQSELIQGYRENNIRHFPETKDRIDLSIQTQIQQTHYEQYQVFSADIHSLTLWRAYFPGWRARLGSLPIRLSVDDQGLSTLTIPSVDEQPITVWMGATTIRRLSWYISALALLGIINITWRYYRLDVERFYETHVLTIPETRALTAAYAVTVVLTVAPHIPVLAQFMPARESQPYTTPYPITSDGNVSLLGYDLTKSTVHPGQIFDLTLYWTATDTIEVNYLIETQLVAPDGNVISTSIPRYPGGYAPRRWQPGYYITDHQRIYIPPDVEAESFTIHIRLATDLTNLGQERLNFSSQDGSILGTEIVVPDVIYIAP